MRILLAVLLMCVSMPALAAADFNVWLEGVRSEARAKGVSEATINAALSNIHPKERIVELDRKQPEGKLTFAQYKNRVITQARIDQGRRLYNQHRELLEQVAQKYGVPAKYIVALWGIETSYGNNTGGFNVVEALATLAHDGRRAKFFRAELMNALKIIDAGHISAAEMKGSWAGAMGQNQFMPSSFNAYAVDGNGDGKRDIWTSLPDVFASTATYLSKSGWDADERWGRAVKLPAGFSKSMLGRENKKPLSYWNKIGVRLLSGAPLPQADISAGIVAPDGLDGPAFLVYSNYDVIMKWNRSIYFATSVGLLADAIAQ